MTKYVNLDDCEVVYCGSDGDYEKYNIPYDMPTADVVPVVRCKDCRFRGHIQLCPFGKRAMPHENGYCFYGERRDDAEIHQG